MERRGEFGELTAMVVIRAGLAVTERVVCDHGVDQWCVGDLHVFDCRTWGGNERETWPLGERYSLCVNKHERQRLEKRRGMQDEGGTE